jgi:peptidoglycan hydrolase-like protein with peptidoglycan-binding domain
MAVTNIGVVNYSSTPDTEVAKWAVASQKQMHDDVAPAWGIPAPQLNLVPADTPLSGIDSWIIVVNDAQQRIGLGYHDLYNGQPVGYVLVEYTKSDGQTPSRVFSHEVLEMSIDPEISKQTSPIDGIIYFVEAGDILSFDAGGYRIDDILVSGFGTPAYFQLDRGTVYGIKNDLPGPLPAAAPANMGTMLCWLENGLFRTTFPALPAGFPYVARRPHTGSRRFRRTIPREEWRDRELPSRVAPSARGMAQSPKVMAAGPAPSASVFQGGGAPLTQDMLSTVAEKLGCGVAEIWAIAFTETDPPYGGCNADKRPQILFERHIFHKLTDGRFDSLNPNISNPTPGGYGAGGAHQYDRLSLAMGLDEGAALQSASWGIGQVLGENYREAGCASPQDLARQAFASEDHQLLAVANEIIADGAAGALAAHDWRTFARIYNGPNYAKNNYDSTIRTWYEKFNSGASPDLTVRSAQVYLMYLGFEPSDIDGIFGRRTRSAMNEYQLRNHLPITDELDDTTFASIEADGKAVQGGKLAASGQ